MHSAVIESNSISQIKFSVLCLLTIMQSDHNLTTTVCDGSLLTYYLIMRGVEVILWMLGGSKYDCSNVTDISKNICLCYYFTT